MREAMSAAALGWSTYGEDADVVELEQLGAQVLGQDACLLVPTCAMANLVALLATTEADQVVVAERDAHVLRDEGGAITELARLEVREVTAADGRLDRALSDRALHGAAVLWVENTHTRAGGTVLAVQATRELADRAHAAGAHLHVDGARLANAAVALGVPLAALAAPADTVTLSLNKGLSAPYGALLAGSEEVMTSARVRLKQLGGGTVHKAGLGAAAGSVALRTMLPQLAEDHRRARRLAAGVGLDPAGVPTNIVLLPVADAASTVRALARSGVLAMTRDARHVRFVTHRLVGDAEVEKAATVVREVLAG